MGSTYQKIIELFCEQGKLIPGVYDLLLRGSAGSLGEKKFVDSWSDLDFSVIVNQITSEVRQAVRSLYQLLKQKSQVKITITLVDIEDYVSLYHSHGIRPFYYSSLLSDAQSLLRLQHDSKKKNFIVNARVRENCFSNVAYLMHDLRKEYIACGDDLVELQTFCRHLAKRSHHLIRNAIFVKTGYIDHNICEKRLFENFAKIDKDLPKKMRKLREDWAAVSYSKEMLEQTIHYIFNNVEKVYSETVQYINHQDFS